MDYHSELEQLIDLYEYPPNRQFNHDDPLDWQRYHSLFKPFLDQLPAIERPEWMKRIKTALYLKTEPPIKCWTCLDSGWIFPKGTNNAFICSSCRGEAEPLLSTKTLIKRADFPSGESLSLASFSNFQLRPGFESIQIAKDKALSLARSFTHAESAPSRGTMIYSPNAGTGKTHLAIAIGRVLCHKHIPVLFLDVGEWYATMRSHYSDETQGEADDMIKDAQSISVLILDDLGAPRATPDIIQKLADVIHSRYNASKSIIATTNVSGDQLKRTLGARTTTRLAEMCPLIRVDASNYRKREIL